MAPLLLSITESENGSKCASGTTERDLAVIGQKSGIIWALYRSDDRSCGPQQLGQEAPWATHLGASRPPSAAEENPNFPSLAMLPSVANGVVFGTTLDAPGHVYSIASNSRYPFHLLTLLLPLPHTAAEQQRRGGSEEWWRDGCMLPHTRHPGTTPPAPPHPHTLPPQRQLQRWD
ncbi:unnamed protein product [Closterium sp. NIES-54]